MKIRVYYEDTDAGGIVYHTNYIKYCERSRSEVFFSKGVKPFEDDSSGFVVRKIECDFLGTATLGDILDVNTQVLELKRSSLLLKQWITKGDNTIFTMNILLAYIKGGRVARIPQELKEVILSLHSFDK